MKVFYFADKNHLSKYGNFIYGETYIAMPKGQVPSLIYDMIKFVRGDGNVSFDKKLKELFYVEDGTKVKAKKLPDLDYFSKSDLESLNNAINDYGKTHHFTLFSKSHKDSAYKETPLNGEITIAKIVNSLPNKEDNKHYLKDFILNFLF